jgi:hypothetical protein
MPIDYSKYHPEWKTKIRPDILYRAGNKCEFCNVPNHKWIIRGTWAGFEVYQDEDGNIYRGMDSVQIGDDYVGEVDRSGNAKIIKIVLTVAHLDHDIENNNYTNLRALCQRCHNRHDSANRKKNHLTQNNKQLSQ